MPKVSKFETEKVIEELEKDLTRVLKDFIYGQEHEIPYSIETIVRIRTLSEELLRWLVL